MKLNETRNYIVPLRNGWLKAPRWRRSKRAVAELKKFILKHSKAENVKLSNWINELIWNNGGKNPPAKVSVKVTLREDEVGKKKEKIKTAHVELAVLSKRAERIEEKTKKYKSEKEKKKSLKEKVQEAMKGEKPKEEPTAEVKEAEAPKEHKCEYCDEVFDSKSALKMHMQDEHREEAKKKEQAKVTRQQELQMQK